MGKAIRSYCQSKEAGKGLGDQMGSISERTRRGITWPFLLPSYHPLQTHPVGEA